MYRLLKSEIIPVHNQPPWIKTVYRQVELHHFQGLEAALTACHLYNDKSDSYHYIINESGKKYHEGIWVDYAEPLADPKMIK
ncbi:MAG: hypothetical protein Q9M50_08225 [Methylococcales bacterium]|nr:hypothetical protein [Methylococcales bacterium]